MQCPQGAPSRIYLPFLLMLLCHIVDWPEYIWGPYYYSYPMMSPCSHLWHHIWLWCDQCWCDRHTCYKSVVDYLYLSMSCLLTYMSGLYWPVRFGYRVSGYVILLPSSVFLFRRVQILGTYDEELIIGQHIAEVPLYAMQGIILAGTRQVLIFFCTSLLYYGRIIYPN